MFQRGIRGAITVEENTIESVKESVVELMNEIITRNKIQPENISHVIYTSTKDLDCVYPAKIVREQFLDWQYVPMMCISELGIENSLKMCVRVLVVVNTEKSQKEIAHVYLKGASVLRKDLK